MDQDVRFPNTLRKERSTRDLGPNLLVVSSYADERWHARRAGRGVESDNISKGCYRMAAERRVILLALSQLVFFGKREL